MPASFVNRSNASPLQFKLMGRWADVIRMIQKMGPAVKVAGIYAQTKIATDIKKRVKGHLKNQDLGWKPLSQSYLSSKAKAGLDHRTLIAYGHYYHSIEVWSVGIQHLVMVGVRRGKYTYNVKTGQRSKLEIARIAAVHEFSKGKRVPKRPLWNPVIKEMGGAKGIKALYIKHLIGKLRVMGIPVKPFMNLRI